MLDESIELATWIYALHRTLTDDGYDANKLMQKVGFDFDSIQSTSDHISKEVAKKIWEEVERITQDDAYCLRVIPFVSDTYLNSLVITVQSCESIDDALRSLLKFYRLVDATSKITVSIDKSVRLSISNRCHSVPTPKQDIDLIFGLITKHAPTLMIDQISPISVCLTRPEPNNKQAYYQYFPCPVYFDQAQNTIEFPLHLPNEAIPSANPALWKHLEHYLTSKLESTRENRIADMVKQEILKILPEGTPKLGHVATRLNISERTLQRKLQKDNICFTSLLNNARLEIAKVHLKQNKKTIQEIAYLLGFTEAGNFIRFFKQQTGLTPYGFVKSVTV